MPPDPSPSASPEVVPVAIYTRVSTENQVGGRFDSCESQAAICREHIRKHAADGWCEVASYSDPAYSGRTMNRPGVQALKRHIESGQVRVVLIFKLERVLRSTDEWVPFRSFLQQHHCRLESATEDISESTPSGRLKNNLLMSVAEYERLNTAEKTRAKMLQQAKQGIWNGGMIPFGYAYDVPKQKLEPHPQEADIVRRIFAQAGRLVSLEQIATDLNTEGLRTKTRIFRSRDGTERNVGTKRFRSDGLRIIIANPIYRGALRYKDNEYPGRHAPLVTEAVWEHANAAVAKMLRPERAVRPDQDKHFHLLKGLLVCGCCARALMPHASGNKDRAGKPYRYYDCSHVVKERQDSRCEVRRISAGAIEKAVVQFLGEIGRHTDIVNAAVGYADTKQETRYKEVRVTLDRLDKQLREVNKGIQNCIESMAGGGQRIAEELTVQVGILKDRKQNLTVERERNAQELSTYEGESLDRRRVCESVEKFGHVLHGLSGAEQKALVRLIVERIEVRPAQRESKSRPTAAEIAGDSLRRLELKIMLNVPRLLERNAGRVILETRAPRAAMRQLTFSAEVALGAQGRPDEAAVVAPFRGMGGAVAVQPSPAQSPKETEVHHPLMRAIAWQREMTKNPKQSLRGLARKEGVVAPSITVHFKLLKLAPEIQGYLAKLRDPKAVYYFSLRRLTPLAGLPTAVQLKHFSAWRDLFEQRSDGASAPMPPRLTIAARARLHI